MKKITKSVVLVAITVVIAIWSCSVALCVATALASIN